MPLSLFLRVGNLLLLKLQLSRWWWGRRFTLGTIECFVIGKLLPPTHRAEQSVITDTGVYFAPAEHFLFWTCIWDIPRATSQLFYFAAKQFFPCAFFSSFSLFSDFAWLCQLFGRSLPSSPLIRLFLPSFYPHLPSVRFINQWVVALYGSWDQIRFTLGLNACSHGLLHLKGNSFS